MRKDLRIEMRLRNNVLWKAIHEKHESVSEFCKEVFGCHGTIPKQQSVVGELLNLKASPLNKDGSYRALAETLATHFRMLPEDLFPLEIYSLTTPTSIAVEASAAVGMAMLESKKALSLEAPKSDNPEDAFIEEETRLKMERRLNAVMDTLTFREREILKLRYGIGDGNCYTGDEIATIFKVSPGFVYQTEHKAIRKMQHPKRARLLEEFVYGE